MLYNRSIDRPRLYQLMLGRRMREWMGLTFCHYVRMISYGTTKMSDELLSSFSL
jgi:hypothetical protein